MSLSDVWGRMKTAHSSLTILDVYMAWSDWLPNASRMRYRRNVVHTFATASMTSSTSASVIPEWIGNPA